MNEKEFSEPFERFLDFLADQMVKYYVRNGGFSHGRQCQESSPRNLSGEERQECCAGQRV